MLVNRWDRCKARPLLAGLILFFFYPTECCFERLSTRALEQEVVFRSSVSFSLRAVSLVNSPGVITAKIRLSIRRYYSSGLGVSTVDSLPPSHLHRAAPFPVWSGKYRASSEGQSDFYGSSYSIFGCCACVLSVGLSHRKLIKMLNCFSVTTNT